MVPGVILAAGLSTRMGHAKATLPIGARDTFLTRIIRTFEHAEVADIVVVLGHQADVIAAILDEQGLAPRVVVNRAYESGQFSSLLAGLGAIDRPGVSGMLLMLVDIPMVSPSTVRAVLERYRETRLPIVRPVCGPSHGHPIVVDRSLFDLLRGADPAEGAKPVVRAHASRAGDVEVDDPGAFLDIDTPDAYERLLAILAEPGHRFHAP